MARVSQKQLSEFDGRCEECGDVAELRDARSTALMQAQDAQQTLSTVGTKLVVGRYCGHAYYMLDWSTKVTDPFDERETDKIARKYQHQIEMQLPPPPPKEEA